MNHPILTIQGGHGKTPCEVKDEFKEKVADRLFYLGALSKRLGVPAVSAPWHEGIWVSDGGAFVYDLFELIDKLVAKISEATS